MSKNIVYCSDGTWNGPSSKTNVWLLRQMLADNGVTQCAIYDSGVGFTGRFLSRLRAGAFGDGLVKNIGEGYASIAKVYRPGDRIFLFGFSRGAYTARSLAGMVAYCGLPANGFSADSVAAAFTAYRERQPGMPWTHRPADFVDAHIEMIGVWDTVGAMGVPGALFGNQIPAEIKFQNRTLHPDVRAGYHAIAIDERRRQFVPTLWDAPAPGQTIEQVWFTGVHCDVGGGRRLRSTSLSEITLAWMVDKAIRHGVAVTSTADYQRLLMPQGSAGVPMRTSWRPWWGLPVDRVVPSAATVANSVAARMSEDRRYRPVRLIDPTTRALGNGYPQVDVVSMASAAPPETPHDLERTGS